MSSPTPRPHRSAGHERELHAAVAAFLRLALKPPTTWSTFPAGGGGLERGRMLARLGLRPGWPDIVVLHPSATGGVSVVGLELQTDAGRQSVVQRAVEAEFAAAGATYALCRSIDDVAGALARAGVPVFPGGGAGEPGSFRRPRRRG